MHHVEKSSRKLDFISLRLLRSFPPFALRLHWIFASSTYIETCSGQLQVTVDH